MTFLDKYIVVNATALDKSGALSILRQFIENIPEDNTNWLVFIPPNVSISCLKQNVRLEPIFGVKSMHKRLWWDAVGLNKWLIKHNIIPTATISLQNTGFRVSAKDIPKFIYYHQSIPFYPYKWNIFRKEHRSLWFYKNIYPFFVKIFLTKNTKVIVQLDFIKKGFIKRFIHDPELVKVFCPEPPNISSLKFSSESHNPHLLFFYPAADYFYKNHKVIIDALENSDPNAVLYLTTSDQYDSEKIKGLGTIKFDDVCRMYVSCDCLLFPSYIETYGLPLIEAASVGMPIIASDLPYAKEVLEGYEGAEFVPYNDPLAWAEAISKIEKGKRFKPIDLSRRPSWKELFEYIKSSL